MKLKSVSKAQILHIGKSSPELLLGAWRPNRSGHEKLVDLARIEQLAKKKSKDQERPPAPRVFVTVGLIPGEPKTAQDRLIIQRHKFFKLPDLNGALNAKSDT